MTHSPKLASTIFVFVFGEQILGQTVSTLPNRKFVKLTQRYKTD